VGTPPHPFQLGSINYYNHLFGEEHNWEQERMSELMGQGKDIVAIKEQIL
jgi:hypothetical protein